jgi:hypothetical protein
VLGVAAVLVMVALPVAVLLAPLLTPFVAPIQPVVVVVVVVVVERALQTDSVWPVSIPISPRSHMCTVSAKSNCDDPVPAEEEPATPSLTKVVENSANPEARPAELYREDVSSTDTGPNTLTPHVRSTNPPVQPQKAGSGSGFGLTEARGVARPRQSLTMAASVLNSSTTTTTRTW